MEQVRQIEGRIDERVDNVIVNGENRALRLSVQGVPLLQPTQQFSSSSTLTFFAIHFAYRSLKDALRDLEVNNPMRKALSEPKGTKKSLTKPLKISHIHTKEKAAVDFFLDYHNSTPSPSKYTQIYDIAPLGLPEDSIIYRKRRKENMLGTFYIYWAGWIWTSVQKALEDFRQGGGEEQMRKAAMDTPGADETIFHEVRLSEEQRKASIASCSKYDKKKTHTRGFVPRLTLFAIRFAHCRSPSLFTCKSRKRKKKRKRKRRIASRGQTTILLTRGQQNKALLHKNERRTINSG